MAQPSAIIFISYNRISLNHQEYNENFLCISAKGDRINHSAESRFYSDEAFKNAAEPKELLVIPNCNHVDLYDDVTKIPFDKIKAFFKANLK